MDKLLLTILITGFFVTVVKIIAHFKLKKLALEEKRNVIYKKMIKNPLGSIYFIFLQFK
jgi:hypothetical protein